MTTSRSIGCSISARDKNFQHVARALRAVLEDPELSIGDCQTALLAAECVAFLRGAPADLHRDARRWLETSHFQANEALVTLALKSIDAIAAASNLKSYWQQLWPEEQAEWMASVTALRARITDPEIGGRVAPGCRAERLLRTAGARVAQALIAAPFRRAARGRR